MPLRLTERVEILRRRQRLSRLIQKPCLIIIDSAPIQMMGQDQASRYRQDSDFWYYTGFEEPSACFVMMIYPDYDFPDSENLINTRMFVQPLDASEEIWTGERVGPAGVVRDYHITSGYSIKELPELLREWLINFRDKTIYYHSWDESPSRKVISELVEGKILTVGENLLSPTAIFHQVRCVKSEYEIDLLRQACQISAQGHIQLMKCAKKCTEFHLNGLFTGYVMMRGCERTGYPSIIGTGINATILHYEDNNAPLKDGDLVLVDAGGEFRRYTADITRVWPVNGKFTEPQKELYNVVLQVQKACINFVTPGMTWEILQERYEELITLGLMKLGLLEGDFEQIMVEESFRVFAPHKIGHWLGLDVHDCGEFDEPFQEGHVLTVEPGIYVGNYARDKPHVSKSAVKRYYGIGVRIEDDVLVTPTGHEVLSADVPKEVNKIESLVLNTPNG